MLRFVFHWDEKTPRRELSEATLGSLSLNVEDKTVWNNIHWSWSDLLDFLCTNWKKLQNEGILPANASESEKYDFNISHDLAYARRGSSPLPSIIFARKGLNIQITTGDSVHLADTAVVMSDLRALGNAVAKRLISLSDSKAQNLIKRWSELTGFSTTPPVMEKREGPPRPLTKNHRVYAGPRRKNTQ